MTAMTALLACQPGRLLAGCLLCAVASMLAVRIGPHVGYWTVVLPVAVLFGLGLAYRCDVELELGRQLIPRYTTPDEISEAEYLRSLVRDGLRHRYGDPPPAGPPSGSGKVRRSFPTSRTCCRASSGSVERSSAAVRAICG